MLHTQMSPGSVLRDRATMFPIAHDFEPMLPDH